MVQTGFVALQMEWLGFVSCYYRGCSICMLRCKVCCYFEDEGTREICRSRAVYLSIYVYVYVHVNVYEIYINIYRLSLSPFKGTSDHLSNMLPDVVVLVSPSSRP